MYFFSKIKLNRFFLFILYSLLLFSCKTTQPDFVQVRSDNFDELWYNDKNNFWNEQASYFYTCDFFLDDEKTICHAIKIDLTSPQLLISLYPDKNDITAKNSSIKIKAVKASSLAKKNDIVINTIQWSQKIPFISEKIPIGIIQNKEIIISPVNRKYAAISFYKKNNSYTAKIIPEQNLINFSENPEFTFGGFWQILSDSHIENFKEITDSRTALGISKDQKTLYILIAEGEQKFSSKGLSYIKCAEILSRMGAFNAIELDGGSSTTLYIHGKNVLSYNKNPKLPSFLCFTKLSFDK